MAEVSSLVSEVVEGSLLERAVQLAATILEAPLATLQFTKKYFVENGGRCFEESFAVEHDWAFREIILKC